MQRLGIELKMAFAVAVRDSFSGKALTGSQAMVSLPEEPGNRPLTKQDGFYVALQRRTEITKVRIRAAGFHDCEIYIDKSVLQSTGGILYAWMVPDHTYQRRSEGLLVTFSDGKPGEEIKAVCLGKRQRLKLLTSDSSDSSLIRVFQPGGRDQSGRRYIQGDSSGPLSDTEHEFLSMKEEASYFIAPPPESIGNENDRYLYPIMKFTADSEGKGSLLLRCGPESEAAECIFYYGQGQSLRISGEKGQRQHVSLYPGQSADR